MKYVVYTGLSCADFCLTFALLSLGALNEVNPIAYHVVTLSGCIGLAAYKGGIVAAVLYLLWYVGRSKRGRERGYGKLITYVAVCTTGVVVGWSCYLMILFVVLLQ